MRRLASWSALLGVAASGIACAGTSSTTWADLWVTPAQRAQHALDAGQPLEAARLFPDPRHQAHAYALAGQDARAAQLLKPFHDVDSEYNRGNALARSGRLLEALIAYNSALRQAPADLEVRYNRDLVAQALEEQSAQSGEKGGGQSRGGAGERSGRDSAGGERSQERSTRGPADSNSQQRSGTPNGGSAAGNGTASADDAQQARRDAELGATLKRSGARSSARTGAAAAGEARNPSPGANELAARTATDLPPGRPQSERELALEQWLRRIPDDPGGLLRRKFLIEHIARHQGGEP